MLQGMIIDWDVKWPHAGKVTADTAANHTVSRQRSREWRREGGLVKIAFIVSFHKKTPPNSSSQALSQRACPQATGAPGRTTNHADLLGHPE